MTFASISERTMRAQHLDVCVFFGEYVDGAVIFEIGAFHFFVPFISPCTIARYLIYNSKSFCGGRRGGVGGDFRGGRLSKSPLD